MHYILLAIALGLGKENIDYMKVNDIKNLNKLEKKVNNAENKPKNTEKKEEITQIQEMQGVQLPEEQYFLGDEEFMPPYIPSDNFAELLPEDEFGNVIKEEEEQGPKLIESIKNKILEVTEKKEAEVLIGSQVEGPSFFDNIKNKITGNDNKNKEEDKTKKENKTKDVGTIIASEEIGPSFIDNVKNKIEDTIALKKINEENLPTIIGSQVEGPNIVEKIKEKTKDAKDKIISKTSNVSKIVSNIKDKIVNKEEKQEQEEEIEKVKIVGTLFDSELNNALKNKTGSGYEENILNKEIYNNLTEIEYNEDEEYQKFINEKNDSDLVKPERILAPNIIPRKKELMSYKNTDIPQELLDSRSFQNRHIPSIMQNKDRQAVLEKIIEYGMITEFRAFMNDLRDSNMVMLNQYTLLTYATKNKQYDIMKYLIHIGANVNKRDDRLDTPLNIAVRNNDMEAVKILLNANANPDMPDILKRTPLIYCIEKNQEPMGIYLIENGADINIKNGIGEGTLAMSIRLGRNMIKQKIIDVLRNNNDTK